MMPLPIDFSDALLLLFATIFYELFKWLVVEGNCGKPNSFRNALCFAVAFCIALSMSINAACVVSRLISVSPTAVLM
jgi:hypothetical protein